MKLHLILLFAFTFSYNSEGQNTILYDLDSYKRVNGIYRTTLISPDAFIHYNNVLNDPNQVRQYQISLGGSYSNNQIINNQKEQKSKYSRLDFNLTAGTSKHLSFVYVYDGDNRSYNNESAYFKHGFYIRNANTYSENQGQNKRIINALNTYYDLGFGFGRIEVVNDAWLGARILEELHSNGHLTKIPTTDEMKLFFDLVGDLEFERVMDNRLRSIYQIETIIEFLEQREWIDRGSIPAFANIYDAFRYENFIFRKSGERIEFTLSPSILSNLVYNVGRDDPFSKFIQAGFTGTTEYEIHKNGDLAYNTVKLVGGKIEYFEKFRDEGVETHDLISANVYFEYRYRYLPSYRTNLQFAANVSAGFVQAESINSTLRMNAGADYNYYFSPSTRIVLSADLIYNDFEFQMGPFQPNIRANFNMNLVHALR